MMSTMSVDRIKDDIGKGPGEQNLLVSLRIRPMAEEEIIHGANPIAHCVDDKMVVLMDPLDDPDDILRANRSREKQYVFDVAFDGSATQNDVYRATSQSLIPNVIHGFNATVFAYGATGTGKTYTMLGTNGQPGIMALALNDLFLEMERTSDDMSYRVTMSYLEIYNEMIRDLLNPASGFLELREDSKGVQVAGLSEVTARSTREVMDMLLKGNKERTQEPTAANKTSSRSHAVLQVTVKQRNRVRDTMQEVRVGKLFLIDLAGSERAANTHNRGKRMVEGAHINRSLLALGNCINALSDKNVSRYINYRDSKLTRLLKDSLGGNCKTVMIAHISPASMHFEESRNTLVYADRAKQIKTKVRKNVLDVTYHIAQYTNIISELREEIKRLRDKLNTQGSINKSGSAIKAIQSEVMEVARREDQTEMNRLREQLLTIFKDQMELRRTLMELNNTAMEISLETSRNQLLIKEFERDKALGLRRKPSGLEEEKLRELDDNGKEGSDESPEPEDIQVAKEELRHLFREKERTEKLKAKVEKELENARDKSSKLEETLPRRISNSEQQEIIKLMCRVHELEIENMEMQAVCLLHEFELQKKDMLVTRYDQQRNLCEEIIQQQRALIDDHKVVCPKELEDLYDLYQQETEDLLVTRNTSVVNLQTYKVTSLSNINRRLLEAESMSDMDRLNPLDQEQASVNYGGANSVAKKRMLKRSSNNLAKQTEANKVFSQSPRAMEIQQSHSSKSQLSVLSPEGNNLHGASRQPSVLTLSSRTSTPTPPTQPDNKSLSTHQENEASRSTEDAKVISSNTRGIAAVAARRRIQNKAQIDAYNNEKLNESAFYKPSKAIHVPIGNHRSDAENYLTASRLANHEKRYGGSTSTLRHLVGEDGISIGTADQTSVFNESIPTRGQQRPKYRNPVAKVPKGQRAAKRRTKSQERGNSYYQTLSKTSPRKGLSDGPAAGIGPRPQRRNYAIAGTRGRFPASTAEVHHQDGIREFETGQSNSSTVYQAAPDRGRGLTIQKRVLGPASDSSGQSTPLAYGEARKSRKPAPTIPNYRRGDISVSGYAIR